ncbi:MAG: 4-aminobutyrate aminotransferase [Acidimicrobiaceae bacterium]|jgi:4-aminobutyrate aminotransferase|nr:4-aminobutyrate aminotransferase [Acidimicrobiaceae bacterium]
MADDLTTRHRAVLPSWLALYYAQPIELVRGEGRHVWDADGNRYLDFFGGILTTISGHGVAEVVDAIREQAGRLLHTSTLYLSQPMVELAEKIGELSGIPDAKVFFTPSGSEANDAALLLATCFRQSNQVLALRNSYHGRSFSAIAITGNRSWSPTSLSGLSVAYVHGGYRLRSPYRDLDDTAYTAACVQDLRDVLDMCTSGDVACMIAEPIQGVGGFAVPPDGFFGAMKEVLDRYGILFVSDEVQTGWGRTGDHFWGYQAHGMVPDLLTFAKGVGNGLALGGVVAPAHIMDCITANSISTFGGNPLATAGARANLDYLLSHDLQGNALKMGQLFMERLRPLVEHHPFVAEVRGRGLMVAIETCRPGGITPWPEAAGALMESCRTRGLLIGKGGLYGNVLRIAPPLSLTASEANEGLDIIEAAIEEVGAAG